MGRVIILNGVSSAGKSTLARAIQDAAPSTFLHVEMDKFISFLPEGEEFKPEWFALSRVESGDHLLPRISNGPRGEALLAVMRLFVINAAQQGLDLVVDEVCHAPGIADYRDGLALHELQIVKVVAPLDVMEERERARGDRLIGLAREQSMHLHDGIDYDIEIDTHASSSTEAAARILSAMHF